ncbi:MAG: hypothetical protein IJ783_09630 [Kiritimatiellae bacterium]|nr:hypothetical protein [Kiritimatiellia bacterium]
MIPVFKRLENGKIRKSAFFALHRAENGVKADLERVRGKKRRLRRSGLGIGFPQFNNNNKG